MSSALWPCRKPPYQGGKQNQFLELAQKKVLKFRNYRKQNLISGEVKEAWLLYDIQGPVLSVWAWACLRKEERIPWVWGTRNVHLWDHFSSIIPKINPKPSCHYLYFQIHLPLGTPVDQLSNKWEPPYSYTNLPHTWQDRGVLLLARP